MLKVIQTCPAKRIPVSAVVGMPKTLITKDVLKDGSERHAFGALEPDEGARGLCFCDILSRSQGGLRWSFKVCTSMRLPTAGPVTMRWSVQAIKAYLIQYLIGGNLNITGMDDFDLLERWAIHEESSHSMFGMTKTLTRRMS